MPWWGSSPSSKGNRVYLSEALSMFSRLFGIAAEPNVGVGFIPILQGQQRLTASEAVRYPFSAWCLTAAGCGPCGRPLTIVNCIYALFIFGRPLTLPSRTLQLSV